MLVERARVAESLEAAVARFVVLLGLAVRLAVGLALGLVALGLAWFGAVPFERVVW